MKIKIDLANNERINSELGKVNGKASAFAITSTYEVLQAVRKAETRLKVSCLPKSMWNGTVFTYVPAGPTARSYKYNAASTLIRVERGANDWFLALIAKAAVSPCERENLEIRLTQEQAAEIQKRAVAEFLIIQSNAIAA